MPAPLEELVELRHDLHRHPELGYMEQRTHDLVCARLRDLGIESRRTWRAAPASWRTCPRRRAGAGASPCAPTWTPCPITERTGLDYASENPGVMHACGHDGHMTILLGAAAELARTRASARRSPDVPARRGGRRGRGAARRGGRPRTAGTSRRPTSCTAFTASRLAPVGQLSTRSGPMMAAATQFRSRSRAGAPTRPTRTGGATPSSASRTSSSASRPSPRGSRAR